MTLLLRDVKPGQRAFSIKVTVSHLLCRADTQIGHQGDGGSLEVAEFLVYDESAKGFLQVWDADIQKLQPGKTYLISQVYTKMYRGFIHLISKPFSIIEITETVDIPLLKQPDLIPFLFNISNVEYEYIYG